MDNKSKTAIKVDAITRLLMNNMLSGVLPLYVVTEYPKSGGTWVGQMVSEYLRVPFPRNRMPTLTSNVMHCHYLYNPLLKNVICVMRDGRDVMVSSYYHSLFQNDKNSPHLVEKTRKALKFKDCENVEENLPLFIEYAFESKMTSKNPFQFTWSQFVRSWINRNVSTIKYEDLIGNAVGELSNTLHALTRQEVDTPRLTEIVEKYSFSNQSKRQPGQENKESFLRKGLPGDWKEKFTNRACEVFDFYGGEELIALGYETDRSWLKR